MAFARELQPGWWVLRDYLAALIWAMTFEPWWSEALPFPRFLGRRSLGLLLAIGLIVLCTSAAAPERHAPTAGWGWR